MRLKKSTAQSIAYFGILVALIVVLQLFASAIPMFGITLNLSLIPIVLAGIFFGMWGGGALGLISGLITFLTTAVMGREPATAFLFQASPALLTLVCIGKTTIAGFVAGLCYRLVSKKNVLAAAYVAAVLVALLNTAIYLLGMVLMKDAVAAFLGTQATATAVFTAVFALIWLNSLLEIIVNVLLAPALHRVVFLVGKKWKARKKTAPALHAQSDADGRAATSSDTALKASNGAEGEAQREEESDRHDFLH